MNSQNYINIRLFLLLSFILFLTSCAAGGEQFTQQSPAGFLYGLWHGVISMLSLIIHIFNNSVLVYETNNAGGWYDFGFLTGVIMIWGGGCHVKCKSKTQKERDKEWEEIGKKVEKKVMHKLKDWAADEEGTAKDEEWKDNPDYHPCYNCDDWLHRPMGAGWIEKVDTGNPLTVEEAKEAIDAFFIQNKRRFKLSTHANGTLTIKEIKALLDVWEREDGFVPDVIAIDYADLLVPEARTEFRHQVDEIWRGLRNLSQERHCLVVTATQADARSYEQNRLKVSNFSEDKRKNAHVTAMYGLNQDPKDREKQLGWMRINEIVIREGDFSNSNEVYVLQNLRRGRPFLGSFW